MVILERVELTASGRPLLRPLEVEHLILDKVDLEFEGPGGTPGQLAEAYKGGYAVLTSQRLIWMDNAAGPNRPERSCWLPVHSVRGVQRKSKMAFSGTKVRLQLDVAANFEGRPVSVDGQFHKTLALNLRCRGDGPEALMAKLQEAMRAASSQAGQPPAHTGGAAAAARPQATPAAAPPVRPPPPPQQPVVNEQLLNQLLQMGFPRNRSARSLLATQNAGIQEAIDYMLAFGDQPGLDDPLPSPSPAAVGPQSAAPYGALPWQGAPVAGPSFAGTSNASLDNSSLTGLPYPSFTNDLYPTVLAVGQPPQSFVAGPISPQQFVSGPSAAARPASSILSPAAEPGQPSFVGVTGIVRREEQKVTDTGRTLSAAFQDLQALMGLAADMVKLAERFRGVVSQAGHANEDELLDRETQLQLIAMGISSPVTKESAGARYSVELSRQLADFLIKPLQQSGGIMTLPDVYCLYNRARGTELVSPDDLLQAIKMFNQLGLPLQLRSLPSGLPVVQSAAHSDDQVCQRIAQMAAPSPSDGGAVASPLLGPPITATDVAKALAVSLPIAREHLLTAELRGVLCRDDGPEGLRFFNNFFRDRHLKVA